jgi:hypothetical protein
MVSPAKIELLKAFTIFMAIDDLYRENENVWQIRWISKFG